MKAELRVPGRLIAVALAALFAGMLAGPAVSGLPDAADPMSHPPHVIPADEGLQTFRQTQLIDRRTGESVFKQPVPLPCPLGHVLSPITNECTVGKPVICPPGCGYQMDYEGCRELKGTRFPPCRR